MYAIPYSGAMDSAQYAWIPNTSLDGQLLASQSGLARC